MLKEEKKCIAVHLPLELVEKISAFKSKTGQSQNSLLIELIEKGLDISKSESNQPQEFFFVRVRIDTAKMLELGKKLQTGELDTSQTIITMCVKNDPSVGFSFWQAENRSCFDEIISAHKEYYQEIMEIIPVITPGDAMKLLLADMQ